jgi:hypothetical protein
MKRSLLLVVLLFFSCATFSDEQKTVFTTQSWPVASLSCQGCIPFQFDQLGLQLPKIKLLGIHVLHMNMPAVSLLYQSDSPKQTGNISLLLMDERKATGGVREEGFYKRLSVATLQQYFIALGRANADRQALDLSREVLGIHETSEYVTISGESASAFWIKSRDYNNQRLYIVAKDSNYAYQIGGPLTDEIVKDFLFYAHFE